MFLRRRGFFVDLTQVVAQTAGFVESPTLWQAFRVVAGIGLLMYH